MRSMNSVFAYILIALSFGFSAHADYQSIDGRWTLSDRVCSSGAQPRDSFILGRDAYGFEIHRGHFRSYLRVAGCEQWTSGQVLQDRTALHFYVRHFRSSCPGQTPPEFHYNYRMNQDGGLSIFMGPYQGYRGSCRHGEFLESIFSSEVSEPQPQPNPEPMPVPRPTKPIKPVKPVKPVPPTPVEPPLH